MTGYHKFCHEPSFSFPSPKCVNRNKDVSFEIKKNSSNILLIMFTIVS